MRPCTFDSASLKKHVTRYMTFVGFRVVLLLTSLVSDASRDFLVPC